jgi:UDP-glucose 4-epimerase
MKKKILVTGGAGYIGSHTVVELVAAGYDVVIADDLSNSEMGAVEGVRRITGVDVPFERVDCNDRVAFGELFRRYSFDAVIHFAAFKAVGGSVAEPLEYYRNNIGSFVTLLELMRSGDDNSRGDSGHAKQPCCNVVFSSSATVYGQPEVLPATETTPRQPATSPYGATKQICEDILRDSVKAYPELRGISLRYFNPIGAHPSALIGELPKGVPNNLIPFITQTAAGIRPQLSIFGDDYNTPDGTALRDYIDVVDLARAHVVAVGRMLGGGQRENYEVFNIGTGRPVSVMELVKTFERVNDLKLNYKIAPRRAGDVEAVWADTTLAEKELGWRATRTLDETLRSAWAWQQTLK